MVLPRRIAYPFVPASRALAAVQSAVASSRPAPLSNPSTTGIKLGYLRFRVTKNPAPMKAWSPYPDLDSAHLSGYMISERGQFKLTALPSDRRLLEGTTWYHRGLWPSIYWRWWSDAIIHRFTCACCGTSHSFPSETLVVAIAPSSWVDFRLR
jgi:hypothetical protein